MTDPVVRRSAHLLARMLDAPDLVQQIHALPPEAFAACVRQVGVADAGELIALASTPQLVAAFDEDLFVNDAPGEQETFDSSRFAVWLEVLLEAGDAPAAARFADLSEEFVIHAFTSVMWVFDDDLLRERATELGSETRMLDKALETSLSQEIDGYLLIALQSEAWDALMQLIVALDRDHRSFLTRVLDRCAAMTSPFLDDLDELTTRLNDLETVAEDVEAAREERRAAEGYVEPRAARHFLALARKPLADGTAIERDPITKAYFRDLARGRPGAARDAAIAPGLPTRLAAAPSLAALSLNPGSEQSFDVQTVSVKNNTGRAQQPLAAALLLLQGTDPNTFGVRLSELVYLANVIVAGAGRGIDEQERYDPHEAIRVVLTTVQLGALLELSTRQPSQAALARVLQTHAADRLFRRASSVLGDPGYVSNESELAVALQRHAACGVSRTESSGSAAHTDANREA